MTGKDGVRRYSMFFAGVPICAAGIALITRAGLGTSPISSIPFVLSLITPPTMGVYTFVFNMLFLACEALLLRRFTALQALQIPATLVFSACIDLALDLIPTQYGGPYPMSLLYLAAGIYPQNAGFLQEGTVRVEGQEPAALGPGERCALVGMLFQNPELQFCMDTVENELFFCLENRRVPRAEMEERLSAALDFCGIAHLRRRPLRSLSGGEKQRAALACLAALRPAWILLDEPFANLDDQTAALLCGQLARLHRECGTGILAIDHRLDHWLSIADEIRLMAQDGTLDGAAYAPSALSPQAWAERGVSVPGCPYQAARPVKTGPEEVVLSLRGLRVSQDGREVLRDVNADFFRGRIHAIVGPSGSGKSTLAGLAAHRLGCLFGALSGLYRYQGSARLEGMELSRHRRRLTGRMGFVTQSPQDQFVADTVLDEVTVSLRHSAGAGDPAAGAEEVLRRIQLWRFRRLSPYMLSQGQQRRLGVAALLAYDCQVLVCDEPTYAQDRGRTAAIMDALQQEVVERGLTLILSTHDRALAQDYADILYELKEGSLYEVAQSRL